MLLTKELVDTLVNMLKDVITDGVIVSVTDAVEGGETDIIDES